MFRPSEITLTLILFALSTVAWSADALQDPTRPYASESRPALRTPAFTVSAILISDVRRVAILNGKAVSAGDRINGATVHAIRPDSVQLKFQGRTIEAALRKGKIRE